MRKLISILLLMTFIFHIKAQNPLDVRLLPQQGAYYCWAGCAEMIVDYYNRKVIGVPLYSQCTIATTWLESRRVNTNPTAPPIEAINCCPKPCPNYVMSYCDKPIADLGEMNQLFTSLNYVSGISATLTVSKYKKQIDNLRQPLVAALGIPSSGYRCIASHVVVAMGYTTTNGVFQIIVHDPITNSVCVGSTRKISFSLLEDNVDRVCSYLWVMKPKPRSMMQVSKIHSSKLLFDTILQNSQQYKWEGELAKPFKNIELANIFLKDDYSVVPVKYIDFQKLISSNTQTLEEIEYKKNTVVELVHNKSKPHTVNRYQLSNGKWISTSIFQQAPEPILPFNLNDKNFELTNQNLNWKRRLRQNYINANYSAPLKEDGYEKVLVPPLYYQFHRFRANHGKIYYKPLGNYPDLKVKNADGFFDTVIYNEADLLKSLKNKAIEYDKMIININSLIIKNSVL
jgi:Papain-like cysteine protease AvrRpt2